MESGETVNQKNKFMDDLVVPVIIVVFAVFAWLFYAYENRFWFGAFQQVLAWIASPTIYYTSVQIQGIPMAFLATIEVLILGFACSHLLFGKEKDASLSIITSVGLGFGITGLVTIVLGIFGVLYVLPLNVILLVLSLAFLSVIVYRKKKTQNLTLKEYLKHPFSNWQVKLPPNLKFWFPACLAIAIIFFFISYQALLAPIVHWDAIVYHAVTPVFMYNTHSIPIFSGPSIGIEMSANFPPLFSALGAFYYIQIGSIQDIFLRAIPPVMGALTILATYKIGEILAGKKFGLTAALFLTLTPLFFRYSFFATSYSTLTFFCTVSVLFLLLAINRGNTKYWIGCGFFFGFALLTSYLALYLVPFLFIVLIFFFMQKKNPPKVNLKKAAILISSAIIIGGVWYLRNLILVGNPIYPNAYTVLGGINIDPLIMQTTVNGIKLSSMNSFFAGQTSFFDQAMIFLTYRTSFPAISLLTILGLALLATTRNKNLWLIAIWPLSLGIIVMSGISWGFPRHLVFAMPGFAIISALPIIKALEICKKYDAQISKNMFLKKRNWLPRIRKSDVLRVGLVIMLFAAFLFPSLTLSMGGKISEENLNDGVPNDYLWFLENPNNQTWFALDELYPEAVAWQWLNTNLNPGEKVATVENRIYYVKNCSNDYFFYLDGWEARDLYNITDPTLMVQFLRQQNVTCVVDVLWAHEHGHFKILPMANFLGSPYFPTILDHSSDPNIYHVGPYESAVTADSQTIISTSELGWSEVQSMGGVYAQSVLAGNDSARLFVSASKLTVVKMTYLDVGKDILSINLRDPISKLWIHDFAIIQKNNTGEWKSFEFLTPPCEKGFLELGLHSYTENFTISKIDAAPYQSGGTLSLGVLGNLTLANERVFPKLIVYLPWLNESEKILFQANSHGKQVGMEVYEGVIQPWETSSMASYHYLAARVPPSMVMGEINPSLILETKKSGVYTLVIELRDGSEGANVDLQILRGRVT